MDKSDQISFFSEVMSTLERLTGLLGFHDLTSFFITLAFVLFALAFGVSAAIFLVKKHRERKLEIEQVVASVQKEIEDERKAQLPQKNELEQVPAVKSVDVAKKIEIPKVVQAPHKTPEPKAVVAEKYIELPKVPVAPKKIEIPQAIEAPKEIEKPKPIELAKVETPPVLEVKKEAEKAPERIEQKPSQTLGAALKNTRSGFMQKLSALFSRGPQVSDDDFEAMEAILFGADIGVKTTQKLLDAMRARAAAEKKSDSAFIKAVLKDEMRKIFAQVSIPEKQASLSPEVFMFVGVNGAGKTTSIGKLGAQMVGAGKKVFFGAGDTYRAAAVKQLCLWGEKIGAQVVFGQEKSDPASVLFDAIKKGKEAQADVILCDTAGRLHTKNELMDELAKVKRVVNKAHEGAPNEVFLVVDATMGQNALMQAREFAQAASLTGVILSKLDGSAKGGVALGIVDELKIPIRYIGIGEQPADLREFNADDFVDALFEEV